MFRTGSKRIMQCHATAPRLPIHTAYFQPPIMLPAIFSHTQTGQSLPKRRIATAVRNIRAVVAGGDWDPATELTLELLPVEEHPFDDSRRNERVGPVMPLSDVAPMRGVRALEYDVVWGSQDGLLRTQWQGHDKADRSVRGGDDDDTTSLSGASSVFSGRSRGGVNSPPNVAGPSGVGRRGDSVERSERSSGRRRRR